MSGIAPRCLGGLAAACACALLCLVASSTAAADDDRTPNEILAAIEAVRMPEPDAARRNDQEYVQEFIRQRQEASERRAELIGALYRAEPEHPRLVELMPERWMALMGRPDAQQEVEEELQALVADESSPLRAEAAHMQAMAAVRMGRGEDRKILDAIESFVAIAPEDDRGAMLLYQAAEFVLTGLPPEQKRAMLKRVIDDYPDSPAARQAVGKMRQAEKLGQPFELTFNDAITDKTVSVQDDLKGKVVVVDFWATWCGPCIAEMPKMKQLYAEYKDKGVEFIGVSLDQPEDRGGLDALKRYVRENEIEWPQYYQGNGWESEFSRSWGINAIPALFVIDQQGNLHSNQARGQLERMIPALLEQGAPSGEE